LKKCELAIVIPYFKKKYLHSTLKSISLQTNKNFVVYLGDDCSQENIFDLITEYEQYFKINYFRFESNIGAQSIILQWNRCVRLCEEKWVWLFSDDDEMSSNCVEEFYNKLYSTEGLYNIYRFNMRTIDNTGRLLVKYRDFPENESGLDFFKSRISKNRPGCAVNHIFLKEIFEQCNGFVNYPYAWYSDDASWIAFAGQKGFSTISNGYINWRVSNEQISAKSIEMSYMKIDSVKLHLDWIEEYFSISNKKQLFEMDSAFNNRIVYWYLRNLIYAGLPITKKNVTNEVYYLKSKMNVSFLSVYLKFIYVYLRSIIRKILTI